MSGATKAKDGTRKKWLHGRAVVDGKLRYLSVSAMEKGDSSKPNGCLRRWYYQYIGGIKEAQSDQMVKGERLHEEIAIYLKTGDKILSSQVMAGMHMIPEPGADLLVEHDIVPEMPDGKSGLEHAILRASGVPIVGAIDLIHARGTNKGTQDIEDMYDPAGTVEVIDWKSCRTLNHVKPGPELLKSIQMVGHGKYIFDAEPDARLVRLSHGYFPSQGSPRKTTIRVDRSQIDKSWEHANRVASSIRDAAKETNPDLVEANTQACNAYGKECPAKSVCAAVKNNVMAKFVGQVLSQQLIPAGSLIKKMETPPNNSILANIRAKQAVSTLPEPRPNRGIFGQVGQPSDEILRMKAEIARLEALEKASREEDVKPLVPDISNGPELVPPDAPESSPILASKPQVENSFTQAMASVAQEPVEVVVEKKKRGPKGSRVKKVEVAPEPEQLELPVETVVVNNVVNQGDDVNYAELGHAARMMSKEINLYVDCAVDGIESESLWPLIDHLCAMLTEESKTPDFRASKDLDYGRWKAALAAYIRNTPIPGGNYTLDTHSEIGQVAVETMRSIVRQSGGVMVRGVK